MDRFPDIVMWGPMNRYGVRIFNHVSGDLVHTILKLWAEHHKKDLSTQSILYSNSSMACDNNLIPCPEKAKAQFPRETRHEDMKKMLIFPTGKDGIMEKAYLVKSIYGEEKFVKSDFFVIMRMVCTLAANVGVSSKSCRKC